MSPRDKRFLLLLFLFSCFISLLETIGVSIIMPFIAVAGNFELIHTNPWYAKAYHLFDFKKESDFVIAFGLLLIGFYIARSAVNLLYFHLLSRFAKGRYHLLAYRLFENYVGMPYRQFLDLNSGELSKTILSEARNLTELLSALLLMVSELLVMVLIYGMFLYINWKITLLLTLVLVLNGVLMTQTVSRAVKREGERRERFEKSFFQIIHATVGNLKMVKLRGQEERALSRFAEASYGYARSNIAHDTLFHLPRLFLEALGFSLVALMVIYLVYKYQNDISGAFALLSMFVLGLYRLMPSANRILTGYNQVLFHKRSLEIVHNDLLYEVERLGEAPIAFKRRLTLKGVSFCYEPNKPVLRGIDLEISKGEKVGFVGESGSGKSTLVDLIIGLYRPQSGEIRVDDVLLDDACMKSWRRKIGYIPQNVYLFDATVAENVAMGEEMDEARLIKVLKQANIWDFLVSHHEGLSTRVGDGGLKLSGGQKQRIAIARALYTDPEILVLDEATSALDGETERKIMEEVYRLGREKTLIIVAHRLTTLRGCDKVYRVEAGRIEDVSGTF